MKMIPQTKLCAALALSGALSIFSSLNAAVLVTYDFTGANGLQASTAADFTATNLSAGAITRGANYGAPAASGAFQADGIGFVLSNSAFLTNYNEATAIANNGYFEFSLSVDSGFEIDVSSITFGARRASNKSGPNNLTIRSSLDSYGTLLGSQAIAGNATDPTEVIFNLGAVESMQSVTGTVIFRVYGYGRNETSSSSGLLTISSDSSSPFTVNGTVSPSLVPEPASFALGFGVMAMGVSVLRRRRR